MPDRRNEPILKNILSSLKSRVDIYTHLDIVKGTYAWDLMYPAAAMTAKAKVHNENIHSQEKFKLPARTRSGYRDARYQHP
jgi:hypothetical protein